MVRGTPALDTDATSLKKLNQNNCCVYNRSLVSTFSPFTFSSTAKSAYKSNKEALRGDIATGSGVYYRWFSRLIFDSCCY